MPYTILSERETEKIRAEIAVRSRKTKGGAHGFSDFPKYSKYIMYYRQEQRTRRYKYGTADEIEKMKVKKTPAERIPTEFVPKTTHNNYKTALGISFTSAKRKKPNSAKAAGKNPHVLSKTNAGQIIPNQAQFGKHI